MNVGWNAQKSGCDWAGALAWLGASNPNRQVRANDSRSKLGGLEVVHRIVSKLPGAQDIFTKKR
jgi:hypothetical protein